METSEFDRTREECWNRALHSFGTKWIFEQRGHVLRRRLRSLTFLGIAVPVLIGGLVMSFGVNSTWLPLLIPVASILGLVQLILSVLSLTNKWDDSYAYAMESISASQRMSDAYKRLGEIGPDDLMTRYELLDVEWRLSQEQDGRQGVTEAEKRAGMRAGLRQFRRACSGCEVKPKSMEPIDCPVCGKFRITLIRGVVEA